MKIDMRQQAVTGALIKDNSADWKNIANKEIEENKSLKEQIASLEEELTHKDTSNIIEIDPNKCRNWKYSDRNNFELGDLDDLAEDIKINGQLQPIIVRKIHELDFDYEVICGERRWRACSMAGISLIAMVTNKNDLECISIQTSENKKKKLSPYSLAIVYEKIMKEQNIGQNELAKTLVMPRSSFADLMSFNRVPKEVWNAVEDMTNVKAGTSAYLAAVCANGAEYLNAVISLAEKIREGMGIDNLKKSIDKIISNSKTARNITKVYENDNGELLFRVTGAGRITIPKSILDKIGIEEIAEKLRLCLEDN